MSDDQWKRSWTFALLLNEVNSDSIQHTAKMMKFRELLNLCMPVESVSPVSAQLIQKALVYAILPPGARGFLRPPSASQPL